jgi:hypothetical protein
LFAICHHQNRVAIQPKTELDSGPEQSWTCRQNRVCTPAPPRESRAPNGCTSSGTGQSP